MDDTGQEELMMIVKWYNAFFCARPEQGKGAQQQIGWPLNDGLLFFLACATFVCEIVRTDGRRQRCVCLGRGRAGWFWRCFDGWGRVGVFSTPTTATTYQSVSGGLAAVIFLCDFTLASIPIGCLWWGWGVLTFAAAPFSQESEWSPTGRDSSHDAQRPLTFEAVCP